MNRIYRLVWNRHVHAVQVVSDLTCSRVPAASGGGAASVPRQRRLVVALALGLGVGLASVAQAAIDGADGHGGGNGTALSGVPQGGAGGTGALAGVNDGTAGASLGGDADARGGSGGNLANQGVGGGGGGGPSSGGLGGGGGGGGGALAVMVTASQTGTESIAGGSGGAGGDGGVGGRAGNGGGGGGGAAVLVTSNAVWTSEASSVVGGRGGHGENTGYADDGSGNGGGGGVAILLADGSGLVNLTADAVRGGVGGVGREGGIGGAGLEGGDGVNVVNGGATLGAILGGQGGIGITVDGVPGHGGDGGVGVSVGARATVTNNRLGVIGGGSGNYGDTTGNGAVGLSYGDDTVASNQGAIEGGQAGLYCTAACTPGAGGAGVVSIGSGSLLNAGTVVSPNSVDAAEITGGIGTLGWDLGGAGGEGVILLGDHASLVNTVEARINGGDGGGASTAAGVGGAGGAGVDGRTAAHVTNNQAAVIVGGRGGDGALMGGEGGSGTILAGTATLENAAIVTGGVGGTGSAGVAPGLGTEGGAGGVGGVGVRLAGDASLSNSGSDARIAGGAGGVGGAAGVGGDGGVGVDLAGGGHFANDAVVAGGEGGKGSARGMRAGGDGGVGVVAGVQSGLVNTGAIKGGAGGRDATASALGADGGTGGVGGTGVTLTAASATNAASGIITGGAGGDSGIYVGAGGAGGSGAALVAGSILVNHGAIQGAAGSGGTRYAGTRTAGGQGGTGVLLVGGSQLVNAGADAHIAGGTGGDDSKGGMSGAAGTGVSLSGGGKVTNAEGASITGGAAALNRVIGLSGGVAGAGIVADGGVTILNAGLVSGGEPNADVGAVRADAIDLAGGANRLTLRGGYAFVGNVVSTSADTNGGDTLELDGSAPATFDMSGVSVGGPAAFDAAIGTRYYGFQHYEKSGTGTWTLRGVDAAHVHWKVKGGVLQGDATAIQGALELAPDPGETANVVFDQGSGNANSPARATYAGTISGDGGLGKIGDGTLVITGEQIYLGGTIIHAGTLQLGNGGSTGSIAGDVTDNGTLAFERSDTVVVDGTIVGSGAVVQNGHGMLVLNGANHFTGGTSVGAGTLEVGDSAHPDASLDGDVDVLAGAVLRGHGRIRGDVVNRGTVRPGGSVGVLTVAGNYTQDAAGTLLIDVTPTQASQLIVGGTATIAGTLHLAYAPGTYVPVAYTVLQAQSVSGGFDTVTSSGAAPDGLAPRATGTGNQFALTLGGAPVPTPAPATSSPPATAPAPAPAVSPAAPPVLVAPSDGSIYANRLRLMNLATQRDMQTVLDAALDRRDCGSSEQCRYQTWVQATGSGAKLTGVNGADASRFGLLGGVDRLVGDTELRLGVDAGASRLNTHDGAGGYGHIDDAHVGLYGMTPAGPLELSSAVSFQRARHYLSRPTGVGNALADVDSRASTAGVQLTWPLPAAHWRLAPTMGVLYQHRVMEGVHETVVSTRPLAASYGLDSHHETFNTLQAYGSVSLRRAFQHRQVTYAPSFALGYRRNVRGDSPAVVVNAQDGTAFALRGAQAGRNMATVDVGLAVSSGESWSMFLAYRGLFASGLRDNAASFGFTRHF